MSLESAEALTTDFIWPELALNRSQIRRIKSSLLGIGFLPKTEMTKSEIIEKLRPAYGNESEYLFRHIESNGLSLSWGRTLRIDNYRGEVYTVCVTRD